MDARGETPEPSPSRPRTDSRRWLPVRLVEQTLIVGFLPHRRFQRELLEVPDYRAPVEEELSRTCGVPLAVTTVLQPMHSGQRRDHEGTILRGR